MSFTPALAWPADATHDNISVSILRQPVGRWLLLLLLLLYSRILHNKTNPPSGTQVGLC
jgi:hypothetical protein